MKILDAFVAYLAVTALPLHPFAFASPLATIDYDGYVNATRSHIGGALMETVLGNMLETCQTITSHSLSDYVNATQIHSDSTSLMKRAPGHLIEARFGPEIVPYVLVVIAIVAAVTLSIVWVESDDPKRESFTQNTINNVISQYPKFNWVICHSAYSIGFDGVEGTDYGYTHHELKISWGRTVGFDLYWAKSGTFYRYGDGGFINWAYNGNVTSTDDGGATVHFGLPS